MKLYNIKAYLNGNLVNEWVDGYSDYVDSSDVADAARDQIRSSLEIEVTEVQENRESCVEATERAYQRRIAQLEKALREIAALDYKNAATNGAAYEAVQIASGALLEIRR